MVMRLQKRLPDLADSRADKTMIASLQVSHHGQGNQYAVMAQSVTN